MQTAHEIEFQPALVEAGARRLAALTDDFGYEVRIVVYLRRQDHLLAVHYGQFIKGSDSHDIDFDEFATAFAPRLDSHRILTAWSSAFGADRIRVCPYERAALPGGIVPDFVKHILQLPYPAGWAEPNPDAESINRSLTRDFIEFIRILNRQARASQPVFAREDILETALHADPTARQEAAIVSWLSPRAHRELLATHAAGNAAIARQFLTNATAHFFAEPAPAGDEHWKPYPGLTPDRAKAISQAIQATAAAPGDGDGLRHNTPADCPMTETTLFWYSD